MTKPLILTGKTSRRELSFASAVVTTMLGLAVVAVGACVKKPILTPAATEVRLLVKAEPDSRCNEIGDITTGNDWFRTEEDVKIRLRNRAAEIGANLATLDIIKNDGALLGASGRAFRCP